MKKIFTWLIMVCLLASAAIAFSGSGAGTSGDPYQITTCLQLNETRDNLSAYYLVMNNIDCSATSSWNGGAGWTPIGAFTGNLNGSFWNITDLYINRGGTNGVGLFGSTAGATIKEVSLIDVDIRGLDYTSALIGSGSATLSDIKVTGDIYGKTRCGAVVGQHTGGYVNRTFVDIDASFNTYSGNTIGYTSGGGFRKYENMHSHGTLICRGSHQCGGVVGSLNANDQYWYIYTSVDLTCGNPATCGAFFGVAGCGSGDNPDFNYLYYDYNATGWTQSNGQLFPYCNRADGFTTQEMLNQSTFDGFAFNPTWYMSPEGYPQLVAYEPVYPPPEWSCSDYGSCNMSDIIPCLNVSNIYPSDDVFSGDLGTYDGGCDYCTPSWACSNFDVCVTLGDPQVCLNVTDSNNCYAITGQAADQFTGNVTDYNGYCGYETEYGESGLVGAIIDFIASLLLWLTTLWWLLLLLLLLILLAMAGKEIRKQWK